MRKKESFDLAVGMGAACSCTQALRDAGLQYLSFPFDWLYGSTLTRRIDILCDDFLKILDKDELIFLQKHPWNGKDVYENKVSGIVLNHDFPAGISLEKSLEGVRSKYARRTERLLSLIENSRKILIVWLSRPDQREVFENAGADSWGKALTHCKERLVDRFGDKHDFKFVVFECEEGLPLGKRTVESPLDFAMKISFDYADKRTGESPSSVKVWEVASVLNADFTVADYRSETERQSYVKRMRDETFRKYGAYGGWRLFIGKICYKLKKHWCKRRKA